MAYTKYHGSLKMLCKIIFLSTVATDETFHSILWMSGASVVLVNVTVTVLIPDQIQELKASIF